jgi:hypothetical protein
MVYQCQHVCQSLLIMTSGDEEPSYSASGTAADWPVASSLLVGPVLLHMQRSVLRLRQGVTVEKTTFCM